jgi:hypothetical protein
MSISYPAVTPIAKRKPYDLTKAYYWYRALSLAELEAVLWSYQADMDDARAERDQASYDFLMVGFEEAQSEMRRRERYGQVNPLADIRPLASLGDLKQLISLTRTIEQLGNVHFIYRKEIGWCSCPFHQDGTPSFKADEERGLWYCFSCRQGGDAFTFAALLTASASFADTIRVVCAVNGIDPSPYLALPRSNESPPTSLAAHRTQRKKSPVPVFQFRDVKVVNQ